MPSSTALAAAELGDILGRGSMQLFPGLVPLSHMTSNSQWHGWHTGMMLLALARVLPRSRGSHKKAWCCWQSAISLVLPTSFPHLTTSPLHSSFPPFLNLPLCSSPVVPEGWGYGVVTGEQGTLAKGSQGRLDAAVGEGGSFHSPNLPEPLSLNLLS